MIVFATWRLSELNQNCRLKLFGHKPAPRTEAGQAKWNRLSVTWRCDGAPPLNKGTPYAFVTVFNLNRSPPISTRNTCVGGVFMYACVRACVWYLRRLDRIQTWAIFVKEIHPRPLFLHQSSCRQHFGFKTFCPLRLVSLTRPDKDTETAECVKFRCDNLLWKTNFSCLLHKK